jgi:hypothetical protein
MKWLSIRSNSKEETYELWNTEAKLLALAYHPGSATIRVNSNREKRVMLIGKEGFLKNRTVLRNEYGIKIARVLHENNQENTGIIEFDGTRLLYTISQDILLHLSITKESGEKVLACDLPATLSNTKIGYDHFVLALCWYSFISVDTMAELAYA